MKKIVLETRALSKEYNTGLALDRVNLSLRQGDIYGFIGQNGAGKTTLIRIAAGLVAPTSGEVALFGETEPRMLAQARKRMGCIAESPAFYPKLTAEENLEYYRRQRGIPDKNAVTRALQTVRLLDTGKRKYHQLSLGMKQRLALALAIMAKPDILLLDEPTNGLDPTGIVEFRSIMQELRTQHNMAILISSHILSELSQIATAYGIIHGGRMVKQISKQQLDEQTRRCLSVRVDDAAAAAIVLEQTLHTTDYEAMPDGELRVYSYLDNPSEITFQMSIAGVRVHTLSEVGANLEDYFMDAIGRKTA